MSPEDLPLALERHATSKLRSDEDLFRISTLGFRGEALPSIASVSRFEITSRPAGYDSAYRLRIDGESKISAQMAAAATGTMIELKDLFYNVPARRKFLKSLPTEFSHICDIVNRLALAYPEIHFRLEHNEKILIDFVAVRELRERLSQVLGREVADSLRPFEYRQGVLSVSGYLSSAPTAFPNSRHLMTFVNHRYVRDKILTHAVLHGYETLLMKGQYPAVVLLLDIPFDEVDVNVHPAKYEVNFAVSPTCMMPSPARYARLSEWRLNSHRGAALLRGRNILLRIWKPCCRTRLQSLLSRNPLFQNRAGKFLFFRTNQLKCAQDFFRRSMYSAKFSAVIWFVHLLGVWR